MIFIAYEAQGDDLRPNNSRTFSINGELFLLHFYRYCRVFFFFFLQNMYVYINRHACYFSTRNKQVKIIETWINEKSNSTYIFPEWFSGKFPLQVIATISFRNVWSQASPVCARQKYLTQCGELFVSHFFRTDRARIYRRTDGRRQSRASCRKFHGTFLACQEQGSSVLASFAVSFWLSTRSYQRHELQCAHRRTWAFIITVCQIRYDNSGWNVMHSQHLSFLNFCLELKAEIAMKFQAK